MKQYWARCEVLLWVYSDAMFISVCMVASICLMCVWIIIKQDLCGVLLTHKTNIIMMSNSGSTQRINNFEGIYGRPGGQVIVEIIYFKSSDNHLPELDFVNFLWTMGSCEQFQCNNLRDRKPARHYIDIKSNTIFHRGHNWWVLPAPYLLMLCLVTLLRHL